MPPTLSIVVASGAGGDFLFRCLDALKPEADALGAETICPDRMGGSTAARLAAEYAWVKVIDLAKSAKRPSVPEMRAAGARAATGDILAVIEEHCIAPAGWLAAIRDNFRADDAAIGGPILDDRYARLRDWCVYFSEYNNYLPPWPEGNRYVLNGANIAYSRRLLMQNEAALGSGYWEVVLHPLLASAGAMRAVPAMGAHHTGPFDYGYYLEQRYLLSRVWGGTQKSRVPFAKRIVYLILGPFLPFVLYARTTLRVMRSSAPFGKFIAASPLLFGALFAYVWGEWLGYLLGPGDALERVE